MILKKRFGELKPSIKKIKVAKSTSPSPPNQPNPQPPPPSTDAVDAQQPLGQSSQAPTQALETPSPPMRTKDPKQQAEIRSISQKIREQRLASPGSWPSPPPPKYTPKTYRI